MGTRAPVVIQWYEARVTAIARLAELFANAVPGWRGLARRSWCTQQRSRLHAPDRKVVWVQDGKKMSWALWGAEHGFFELHWAGRLPFLSAVVVA